MTSLIDMYASVAGAGAHDGTTAANAWTMDEATSNVAAGDRVNVLAGTYIADDGVSSAVMSIITVGTNILPIEWRAYTTTIGDFTLGDTHPAVIQAGTNTLTNAMKTTANGLRNSFIGFRFTGGSSHGVDFTTNDNAGFIGCRFDTNGGMGIIADDATSLVHCEFDNNTTRAVDIDNRSFYMGCEFHNEAVSCCLMTSSVFDSSVFYDIGNGAIIEASSRPNMLVGNTFDGDNQAAVIGFQSTAGGVDVHVWNNIFYDLFEGVETGGASTESGLSSWGYNLFSSNGANYSDYPDGELDIDDGTTDPFEDSASRDYTLASASTAIDAGSDAGLLNATSAKFRDIGAIETTERDIGAIEAAPAVAAGPAPFLPVYIRRHRINPLLVR